MKPRFAVAITLAAALMFGAGGYLYGARAVAPESALAAAAATTAAPAGLSEAQAEAVRRLIRDHLIENPEIIRDAIEALQRKEQDAASAEQVAVIADEKERLFDSQHHAVLGNPEGDVTLVEFFDYNCGYCKQAHADMERLLDEDDDLRVVLKEFPVLNEGSAEAAHIAAAVNIVSPERYREFHDALLMERGEANRAKALAVVKSLGLDADRITEVADSDAAEAAIVESYELAKKLSVNGTPSYVTERGVIVGAVGYDNLKAAIEEVRACATAEC